MPLEGPGFDIPGHLPFKNNTSPSINLSLGLISPCPPSPYSLSTPSKPCDEALLSMQPGSNPLAAQHIDPTSRVTRRDPAVARSIPGRPSLSRHDCTGWKESTRGGPRGAIARQDDVEASAVAANDWSGKKIMGRPPTWTVTHYNGVELTTVGY
jgi:hypothetical protein